MLPRRKIVVPRHPQETSGDLWHPSGKQNKVTYQLSQPFNRNKGVSSVSRNSEVNEANL